MDGLFFRKMDIHPGKLYILSQEIRTTEDDVRIAWKSIISFILCDLVDFGLNQNHWNQAARGCFYLGKVRR